ncbi:hypothetical protein [Variovorax sp. JS1663]|uniref:hypothetical protein n=1 Tax=Variovorax sp. JS1663 TaxID=1851577 RepID=UPI00117E3867|nr:hypothetical protein [Variovorax sp. JS1663]
MFHTLFFELTAARQRFGAIRGGVERYSLRNIIEALSLRQHRQRGALARNDPAWFKFLGW